MALCTQQDLLYSTCTSQASISNLINSDNEHTIIHIHIRTCTISILKHLDRMGVYVSTQMRDQDISDIALIITPHNRRHSVE